MSIRNLHRDIWRRIDRLYGSETYFTRQKAFIFMVFMCTWIVTQIVSAAFNILSPMQTNKEVALLFNMLAVTLGAVFLLLTMIGHFRAAANASCIALFAGIALLSLLKVKFFFLI